MRWVLVWGFRTSIHESPPSVGATQWEIGIETQTSIFKDEVPSIGTTYVIGLGYNDSN